MRSRGAAALRRRPGRRPRRPGHWRTSWWTGPTRRRPACVPGAPGSARLGRRLVRDDRPVRLRAPGQPVAPLLPSPPVGHPRGRLGAGRARRRRARRARQPGGPGRDGDALRPGPPRDWADRAVARRSIWILSLLPSAFVLVMGYAESMLLVFAVGCFLAIRPGPPGSDRRPRFAVAGGLGLRRRADPSDRRAARARRRRPS